MIRILFGITFIWALTLLFMASTFPFVIHGASTQIDATVKITVCGDGVVEAPEQCDGANLSGRSCSSLGYTDGGTLSCYAACEFNTSQCTVGSSGGSSGGGTVSTPTEANAVFRGRAYPGGLVTLLKDAEVAATARAGPDAHFEISLSGLGSNSYIFSVYGEDARGMRSPLQNVPIILARGATTNITGIFVPPSIVTDKTEVRRGDTITFFGQTAPLSEVTISINALDEVLVTTLADETGEYLLNFDTSVLKTGKYEAKAKAASNGEVTAFGKSIHFIVGARNVAAGVSEIAERVDINGDTRVDLVDFSIVAYWYKRPNPPASVDLNEDGKIDLIDFSIMAFHWTG